MASTSSTYIYPEQHKQLFLEDSAIEVMSGLERVLHQPKRYGPILRPNQSRGEKHIQSDSVPQWNPEKALWEWWYKGFTTFTETNLCLYATSTDGIFSPLQMLRVRGRDLFLQNAVTSLFHRN